MIFLRGANFYTLILPFQRPRTRRPGYIPLDPLVTPLRRRRSDAGGVSEVEVYIKINPNDAIWCITMFYIKKYV